MVMQMIGILRDTNKFCSVIDFYLVEDKIPKITFYCFEDID